jgi:hypothetical protein
LSGNRTNRDLTAWSDETIISELPTNIQNLRDRLERLRKL